MSGWTMFTICFTTLLVGTWVAVTVFEFYRSNRKMEAAELSVRAPARVRGRNI
ncbi:MAG: hypothetical protein ACJ74T_14515 [Pyrinomonadaceae bacterium]